MKDTNKDLNDFKEEDLKDYLEEDIDLRSINIQAIAKNEDESLVYEEDLLYESNEEVGEYTYNEEEEDKLEALEYIEDIDGLSSLLEEGDNFSDNFEEAFPGLIVIKKKN